MIKRKDECKVEVKVAMRGGDGQVVKTDFVSKEQLMEHGRLFGNLHFEPGCGIGQHDHQNESEIFYVVNGEVQYNGDGEVTTLKAGDVAVCEDGHYHSVKNVSDKPADVVALIVLK